MKFCQTGRDVPGMTKYISTSNMHGPSMDRTKRRNADKQSDVLPRSKPRRLGKQPKRNPGGNESRRKKKSAARS